MHYFASFAVLADCSVRSQFKGELAAIAETKHLQLTDCSSKIKCRKGSTDLGDFFGGRESLLSKYTNAFVLGLKKLPAFLTDIVLHEAVNEDFHNFFEHLSPSLERSISEALLTIGNNILGTFTYKQLFP